MRFESRKNGVTQQRREQPALSHEHIDRVHLGCGSRSRTSEFVIGVLKESCI